MVWFLESLQQCNHWTSQSTWSHSWHVLKEASNKMPLTCIIKQHRKLLYMQNSWHESKLWQLHSDDEKLYEFFFPLLTVARHRCHDSGLDVGQLCAAPWVCDLPGNTPAALLQEKPWWLHLLNSTEWSFDSTWWCGNGRQEESWAKTVCIHIFFVEQRVQ